MPKLTSCGKSGAYRLYDKRDEPVAQFAGRSEVCGSRDLVLAVPFGSPVQTEDTWYCDTCLKTAGRIW